MKLSEILSNLETEIENQIAYAKEYNIYPLKFFTYVQKEQDLERDGNFIYLKITQIESKDLLLNFSPHYDVEISFIVSVMNKGQDSIKTCMDATVEIIRIMHKFILSNQMNVNEVSANWNQEIYGFEGVFKIKNAEIS